MTSSAAYSIELSEEQLKELLSQSAPQIGQAILESVSCVKFVSVDRSPDDFHFDDTFDVKKWEKGRACGETLEVRWRRRGMKYPVLVITDLPPLTLDDPADTLVPLPEPTVLEKLEEAVPVVLWGEWQDPGVEGVKEELPSQDRKYWYELRIPQFLAYPWSGNDQHLVLRVAQYRVTPLQGTTNEADVTFPADRIYRFVGLEKGPEVSE